MSWLDIALVAALAVAAGLAVRKVVLDRRRGKTCGCDCGCCAQNCSKRKN